MRRTAPRRSTVALSLVLITGTALAGTASAAEPLSWRHTDLQVNNSYGEPSLAVAPDGHITVSTPGPGVNYWNSADDGHSFTTTTTESTNGGGDSELDYLPNGDLLSADLEITDSNVKISHDHGASWAPVAGNAANPGAVGMQQDRQWFAHSPDGSKAYLVYHDFAAEGEFFARSTDGGKTWPIADGQNAVLDPAQAITAPGAATTPARGSTPSLIDQGGNTFSGPMLVDPTTGELYVVYSVSDFVSNTVTPTPPYGPTRGIIVEHSADDGATWKATYAVTSVPAITDPSGSQTPTNSAIFSWGTVDQAGNVYVLFNSDAAAKGHFHTYYTVSKDHAKTWGAPVQVDDAAAASGVHLYATGAAGADGVLDMAWYASDTATAPTDGNADWHVDFAQIRGAAGASPAITRSRIEPRTIHHGNICLQGLLCVEGGDRSLLDFFELAIGPDGLAQVAYAANGPDTKPDTAGGRVIWAKQQGGTSALVADAPVGLPEAPVALLLPLSAAVLGLVLVGRRRRRA